MPDYEPYVAGEWRGTDGTIEVRDLADGGTVATVGTADAPLVEEALATADGARAALRETTVPERVGWLRGIAEGIQARREALAEAIVREGGKTITRARGEVDAAIERFDLAIDEARSLRGDYRDGITAGHEGWSAMRVPEPVGVVVCITPFNYPLATPALRIAPALAAGNAVLLKPASDTPVTTALLTEALVEAGVPDAAFHYLPGRAGEIGDALVGDERVNAIAMTGSSAAGKRIAATSGMAELHLELGGNAPAIVFPDADLELAGREIATGALKGAGQRCSAVSRVLAVGGVHDDLVAAIDEAMGEWVEGDLFDEATDCSPLIDDRQADRVETLIDDAVDRGADLVRGGGRDGTYVQRTVLASVPHDARLQTEEQFGPVAPVFRVADESEALALANGTDLALDGAVFTSDYDRAHRVARAIDAGGVRINGAPSHGNADVPYGGNRSSGIGREGIGTTIDAFVRTKSIVL
jgi:glyceraldehyde-3-phosphate dehydrogenase [NAD(P)+]